MEVSIFLAKLLGPIFVIIGIGMLLNLGRMQKLMQDFIDNYAIVYLGGFISLIFGMLLVLFHNEWAFAWTVIITIVGWISLVKGISLIFFPKAMCSWAIKIYSRSSMMVVPLLLWIIIGGILTGLGYFG